MADAGFWDNQEKAQEKVARLKSLKSVLAPMAEALGAVEDLAAMIEMAEEDASFEAELISEIERLEKSVEQLELKTLLSGPHDASGAIMTINARDGGTDANDWAEMLLRMYTQWSQKNDFSVELLDRNDNDEAGINSASVAIRGPMAYGYLKGETGLHRLVRISPFNSEGKRQTSFAAIDVSPEISDSVDIEVDESDVREDRYRASGAGGQHVNKTDSAIRLNGHCRPMPKRTKSAQESCVRMQDASLSTGENRRRKDGSRTSPEIQRPGKGWVRLTDSKLLLAP